MTAICPGRELQVRCIWQRTVGIGRSFVPHSLGNWADYFHRSFAAGIFDQALGDPDAAYSISNALYAGAAANGFTDIDASHSKWPEDGSPVPFAANSGSHASKGCGAFFYRCGSCNSSVDPTWLLASGAASACGTYFLVNELFVEVIRVTRIEDHVNGRLLTGRSSFSACRGTRGLMLTEKKLGC